MKYSDIQAFLAVAEYGSMTRAAESLFLSQSTLSLRIRSLEDELGMELFSRGKGVRFTGLTAQGYTFVPVAEEWEALWKKTRSLASGESFRQLSFSSVHSINSFIMNKALLLFADREPDVRVISNSYKGEQCYRSVESSQVEAAFVPTPFYFSSVDTTPLFEEDFVLLCHRDTPYADGVTPPELDTSQEVYLEWSRQNILWHEHWFSFREPHRVFADNMDLAVTFLSKPGAWAIFPLSIAAALAERGELRVCRLDKGPDCRVIHLATRKKAERSGELSALLDCIREVVTRRGLRWLDGRAGAPGA